MTAPGALDGRLVGLADALRRHGVTCGTSEIVDAGTVITALGLSERERLREGLACALLRRAGERDTFDALFDLWFPAALGSRTALGVDADPPATDAAGRRARAETLRAELVAALAEADAAALDLLAARALADLGRLPDGSGAGSWSALQALEALQPETAIAAAEAQRAGGPTGSPTGGSTGSPTGGGAGAGGIPFERRFVRDELRSEVAAFRRAVETEARRRNAEARGTDRMSRYAVRPSPEHTPFVLAGATEVAELRRTVAPLAQRLATRLAARQRRASRGRIDLRRTLRRSLGTGGIPVRPEFAHRRRHRTDLVLLCDMSQSVAGFSRFTILLVQALATHFRRVRIFGFVNICDELTDLVVGSSPGADLGPALADVSRMTRWHRNSDYGAALADFTDHHLAAIGPRSVVLILGDARTNGSDPRLDRLRLLVERAARVVWLNPEPVRTWDSGDSVAAAYASLVDMHECRDIAQLRQFVGRLLPV